MYIGIHKYLPIYYVLYLIIILLDTSELYLLYIILLNFNSRLILLASIKYLFNTSRVNLKHN